MPTDRYILAPNGVRYDKSTGWAEYKNDDGQWVRFSDEQQGAGSRRDPRLFGEAGYLGDANDVWAQNQDAWNSQMEGRDKSYFKTVKQNVGGGDAGDQWIDTYELNDDARKRLGGRVQINQLGQGGYHEVIDPSQVEWDDEFGFVTKQENLRAPDAHDVGLTKAMPMIVSAALGGIVASAGGGLFNAASEAFGGAPAGPSGWESLGPGDGMTDPSGGGGWEGLGPGDGMTPPDGSGLTQPYMEPPAPTDGANIPGPGETPTSTVPPDIDPVQPTNVGSLPPAPTVTPPPGWSIPGWNALSPSAQRVILQGISTGASAVVSDRNASRVIAAANRRQEDDQNYRTGERERRGAPPAAIATTTPRTIQGGYAASGGLADRYLNRPRGG